MFSNNLEAFDFKAFGASLYSFNLFERFGLEVPGSLSKTEWHHVLSYKYL